MPVIKTRSEIIDILVEELMMGLIEDSRYAREFFEQGFEGFKNMSDEELIQRAENLPMFDGSENEESTFKEMGGLQIEAGK